MNRPRHCFPNMLLAAALCTASLASAQSFYSAEVNAGANAIGFGSTVQPPSQGFSYNSPTPIGPLRAQREASLTNNAAAAALHGQSASMAWAEAGAIHLQTIASGSASAGDWSLPNPNASGQATANALFRDVLDFHVAGAAAGAAFTVLARVHIDAGSMLNATLVDTGPPSFVTASSSWQTRVSMASGAGWLFQQQSQASCSWSGQMLCSGDMPGWSTVSFTVSNGARVVFEMSGTARSSAGALLAGPGSAASEAIVDMGHTLAWGGISQVLDAAGNPVSDFSMVGLGSGIDFHFPYAAAVPEPAASTLALGGLALMGLMGLSGRLRRACRAGLVS